ncbi:MAG: hypothetical protein KDA68_00635 [Planctomycetaceae bacterium]|nr:hypothetical protein [Planctomycetaceae bacterium]
MSQASNTAQLSTLKSISRLPAIDLGRSLWIVSLASGVGAALATCLLDFRLGIPGHAILRSILPMSLGLTLAPFRGSGTIMSVGALVTGTGLRLAGFGEKGLGSLFSLLATGPILDFAAGRAKTPRGMWLGLIAAGTVCNMLAFGAQVLAKLLHLDLGGGKPFVVWWKMAIWTYPLCGAVAGLIAAVLLLRWNVPQQSNISGNSSDSAAP